MGVLGGQPGGHTGTLGPGCDSGAGRAAQGIEYHWQSEMLPSSGTALRHPACSPPCPPSSTTTGLFPVGCGAPPPLAPTGVLQSISGVGRLGCWEPRSRPPRRRPPSPACIPAAVTPRAHPRPGRPPPREGNPNTEPPPRGSFIGGASGAQPGGQPICRPPSTWRCRW